MTSAGLFAVVVFVSVCGSCGNSASQVPTVDTPSDTDGDGIADADDFCADDPEDRDRCDDEDGCSDADDDGDGVLDPADACRYVAESVNGRADEDGCPEAGDIVVVSSDRCWVIWDSVYFASGSSVLAPEQTRLVDATARFLRDCPEHLLVAIEGHIDEQESSAALAAERAEAVRRQMVAAGVLPRRLRAVGHGRTRPADPRHHEQARAKNRRVEFRLLRSLTCPGRKGDSPPIGR